MKTPLKVYIVEWSVSFGCGTTVIAAKDRRACNHVINQLTKEANSVFPSDEFVVRLVPKTHTYMQPGIIHHDIYRE